MEITDYPNYPKGGDQIVTLQQMCKAFNCQKSELVALLDKYHILPDYKSYKDNEDYYSIRTYWKIRAYQAFESKTKYTVKDIKVVLKEANKIEIEAIIKFLGIKKHKSQASYAKDYYTKDEAERIIAEYRKERSIKGFKAYPYLEEGRFYAKRVTTEEFEKIRNEVINLEEMSKISQFPKKDFLRQLNERQIKPACYNTANGKYYFNCDSFEFIWEVLSRKEYLNN